MARRNPDKARERRLPIRSRCKTPQRRIFRSHCTDTCSSTNTTLVGKGDYRATPPEVKPHEELPPAAVDPTSEKWYFISGNSA